MKKETKIQKGMEQLLAAMKAKGVNTPEIDTASVAKESLAQRPDPSYDAEAVLLFLEKPARFLFKPCKFCEEMFGTNYRGVGYCSDNCRIRALQKLGISWDPGKAQEERWGGEPPLIIPPAAIHKLLQLVSLQEDVVIDNPPHEDIDHNHHLDKEVYQETIVSVEQPQLKSSSVKSLEFGVFDF